MEPLPGDLVLYTVTPQSALSSRLVAIGELLMGAGNGAVQYSHVAILDKEPGWEWEAQWPKTGRYPIDRSRPYEVWRIDGITDEQREKVLAYCRAHGGEWYDLPELLTFGLLQHRNAAVCSQFAGRAYDEAGLHISPEGQALLSPNAIPDDFRARLVESYAPPS